MLAVLAFAFAALAIGGCGKRKRGDAYTMLQVSAQGERACAAMKDGAVRCWGRNDDHAFGPTDEVTVPTLVAGFTGAAKPTVRAVV